LPKGYIFIAIKVNIFLISFRIILKLFAMFMPETFKKKLIVIIYFISVYLKVNGFENVE
jgi:hypothetical protein